ncbi:GGDEF domain-containing protein [Paenibacillus athensensis]|uniref:GGDEF domain-containing protein n=1 Tax=Paenibacillus athensensis TaxID=1967502 RepID=A0A4Y8QBN8_9BACL|nr:GGDEF domain-containing protein [Paenibacillus athensensis]MCD1259129.1 GGDEF domain-containing protein [Paenibacillus athensensis]
MTYLFNGGNGPLLGCAAALVIIALMLVMSLRLYASRRKKGYLSITVALVFLAAYYGLRLYVKVEAYHSVTAYTVVILKIVSFVLVQMGVFQLYNRTRRRHYWLFYGLIGLGLLISLLHVYIPQWYAGPEQQVQLLQDIGLELYIFMLIFVFSYLIPPFVGQQGKYQLTLTVFFAEHTAHLLNAYIYSDTQPFLTFLEFALPVLYCFLLFFLLFDRVVELMQAIYQSSITDGLTRLYNRKFFYGRVRQYVQRQLPVSILFSDIDNFKKLNDTKGHHMGDEALKQVAAIVKEACEDCGIAGRYGGEEIVAMVTDPDVDMAAFAEHVRKRIETETIVTVSVGYSMYKSGLDAEKLIKMADEAMYKAKTTGKNKVVKYE